MAKKKTRTYTKRRRAEGEEETRMRILEAVMSIHEEVGPSRTTVSAVAERAGVQRLTVYRHFPTESDVILACAMEWGSRRPFPDLASFQDADPRRRARAILLAMYRFYRNGEPMLSKVLIDEETMDDIKRGIAPLHEYERTVVDALERCWRGRSASRRATIEHAVNFFTWRSLAALAGSDAEAADLVMRWCRGV